LREKPNTGKEPHMNGKTRIVLGCMAAALLGAVSASAETVYGGLDGWITRGDGTSFTDFSREPLPAGFFCGRSQAFTGRIVWQGVPVATDDPQVAVDTIVQRLDDADFNPLGQAVTRIQVRALSLESVAPIRTACGSYDVRATLAGQQPTTRMRIFLENGDGGRYLAPLALNVKLTFTPTDRKGAGFTREITRRVRLGADPRAHWAFDRDKIRKGAFLQVDSDGDGLPETALPRGSNFAARPASSTDKYVYCNGDNMVSCHDGGEGYEHCVQYCGGCGMTFVNICPD
jgi:hypothetical protein